MPNFFGVKNSNLDPDRLEQEIFCKNTGPGTITTEGLLKGWDETADLFDDELTDSIKKSPFGSTIFA